GISWTHDSLGNPWIAVSCQGLGASAWWPCKDAQWDEPEMGMDMQFTVKGKPGGGSSRPFQLVSNGRSVGQLPDAAGVWHWAVKNPINNYDVTFYAGDYVHWHDTLMGEKGKLDLDFWVLRANEQRARRQFAVVKPMLHCFEYWMGPYPFYEDGYKLVEAPYLGMEHQSAVAYGNKYQMGYEGFDRTGTGVGMNFDYIIVHESGHEWFGNNITAKDVADNWIQEGITTYSESLFEECLTNRETALVYTIGEWHDISNGRPLIGEYGVNNEGSRDIYDKGAAIMHMIREMTGNDDTFRNMLRGLTRSFYHKGH
ncbi:MAG: M1 family peptidase, partial [Chitinophagia bacterium]|nr:M1 family peptidase [Chitinophagia bacterium]